MKWTAFLPLSGFAPAALDEVPNPGDYMAFECGDQPLIIIRGVGWLYFGPVKYLSPPDDASCRGVRERTQIHLPLSRLDLQSRRPACRRCLYGPDQLF